MSEFRMPALGADMEWGRLSDWKVAVGDAVSCGDIVATVETDKGAIDIEIWEDGVVVELVAQIDDEVPVGEVIARIRGAGEAEASGAEPSPAPEAAAEAEPSPAAEASAPVPEPVPESAPKPEPKRPAAPKRNVRPPKPTWPRSSALGDPRPRSGVLASPSARRLAREHGLDLASIPGTGPHGAVKRTDVLHAVEAGAAASAVPAAPAPAVPPAGGADPAPRPKRADRKAAARAMRRAVAHAMAKSKREIPHYYLAHDIDAEPALAWLAAANADRAPDERLVLGALLVGAVARAAAERRQLNGFWVDDGFVPGDGVHVGFAIALRGGGLVAPAIFDADRLGPVPLMDTIRALVVRAKKGGLRASEMSKPTITVSSLGDAGVDELYGVIQPPQVALVGFGTPRERPFAKGGLLGVHRVLRATLSGDHRATDGIVGARFLARVAELLQDPTAWTDTP